MSSHPGSSFRRSSSLTVREKRGGRERSAGEAPKGKVSELASKKGQSLSDFRSFCPVPRSSFLAPQWVLSFSLVYAGFNRAQESNHAPERAFKSSLSLFRLVRFPIDSGIAPAQHGSARQEESMSARCSRALAPQFSHLPPGSKDADEPVSLFRKSIRNCRFVRPPIDFGMGPVRQ